MERGEIERKARDKSRHIKREKKRKAERERERERWKRGRGYIKSMWKRM